MLTLVLNIIYLTAVSTSYKIDIEQLFNEYLGPAPESVTNAIFDITKKITQYKISDLPDVSNNFANSW